MDLFLTEEDYLPDELEDLPLDEVLLRVHEEDDKDEPVKTNKSKTGKSGDNNSGNEDNDDDGVIKEFLDGDDDDLFKDDIDLNFDDKDNDKDKEDEPKKAPRRRMALTPRVTLNVDRLKHVNGLAALPGLMKQIKFKGKGYEEEDLDKIMRAMEHWAHRIMPNMKFDDFIEKTEQLGSKKMLKTFVTKIRYDMPLDINGDDRGDIVKDDSDEEIDEWKLDDDLPSLPPPINAEEAFDKLMKEAELAVKERAAAASTSTTIPAQSTATLQTSAAIPSTSTITPSPSTSTSLSEEQRRKIAENARKAAEKRLALAAARTNL